MIGTRTRRPTRDKALALGFSLAALLLLSLFAFKPAHAATFTVNSTGDAGDVLPEGTCDSDAGSAVTCTLREAIDEANRTPAPDTISFVIPDNPSIPGFEVKTISPASPLPSIKETVTVDGYTQAGAVKNPPGANSANLKIELNGTNAGVSGFGLIVGGANADNTKITGLVINRFFQAGVLVSSPGTVMEGNFIGTNAAGDADLGNAIRGVRILSSGNLIGGTNDDAQNVISGNGDFGVEIDGPGASNNRIEGNHIGTDATGTSALGNGTAGVRINGASGNFVGGTEVGASNLISGNSSRGVLLTGDATNNSIQSNFIGINANGSASLGNGAEGVEIFGGSNNVIGGTASRTGNFISGNDGDGVELEVGTNGNRVEGNFIGTGQNGASDFGNGEAGVRVLGPGNIVGGTASRARNVISGNTGNGISIGSDADGTTVQGNHIGPGFDGEDFGGTGNSNGVSISFGSSGNTIGGTAPGAANTIAFNDDHGVVIEGFATGTTGNRVSANSIHSNGLLGINLVGGVETNGAVTENDEKDPDTGPNDLQNFPILTSAATSSGGAAAIQGRLDSTPNTTFTIQFFSNTAPNFPTLFGEGKTFVGETTVTTNSGGDASFTFTTASAVPRGNLVTATATGPESGTSELSAAVEVRLPFIVNSTGDAADANPNDSPSVCDVDLGTGGQQCTLRAAIQEANGFDAGFGDADTILFAIPGTGVRTIAPASPLPAVTQPLTIDGYSQPGTSQNTLATGTNAVLRIQLNGDNAGTSNGLNIDASGSLVRGLAINRFARGIRLDGSENTRIEGNFVGTNAAGTVDLGNSQQGIAVVGGGNNAVGGIELRARNVISGNGGAGVFVGVGSTGNGVEGNLVGTNKDGTGNLGNSGAGVIVSGASENTIGGATLGAANTIRFNGGDGVTVTEPAGTTATGNRILRNSIFSNDGLGIDLDDDGPTANDNDDPDTGPNMLQNKPALASATTTTIQGSLNSTPGKTFTIQFFRSPSGDEGVVFIGQRNVTTNANGIVSFSFSPAAPVAAGQRITATATRAGNTSEFSAPRTVTAP